jgi:hypothetical protein
MKLSSAALLCLALSCVTTLTLASPEYPGLLQDELDMPCAPQCTVCHRDTNGGTGTAITPFAVTMREEGLRGGNQPARMRTALDGLTMGGYDSDGDGRSDIEELRDGANPNQPGDGLLCAQYGCGSSVVPNQRRRGVEVLILAAVLGFGLVRWRLLPSRRKQA